MTTWAEMYTVHSTVIKMLIGLLQLSPSLSWGYVSRLRSNQQSKMLIFIPSGFLKQDTQYLLLCINLEIYSHFPMWIVKI